VENTHKSATFCRRQNGWQARYASQRRRVEKLCVFVKRQFVCYTAAHGRGYKEARKRRLGIPDARQSPRRPVSHAASGSVRPPLCLAVSSAVLTSPPAGSAAPKCTRRARTQYRNSRFRHGRGLWWRAWQSTRRCEGERENKHAPANAAPVRGGNSCRGRRASQNGRSHQQTRDAEWRSLRWRRCAVGQWRDRQREGAAKACATPKAGAVRAGR